ncbi:MAG TPA: NFACT RNA binding domain-containing protein [Gemmatimonadaceae bacterium]|nr:NFACT RNA binding domain-containing protein [Gemmatimonadaceae bacterium]
MDSLTTHYVARELDARWRGRRILAVALRDAPRAAVVHVDGSDAIAFDLSAPEPCVRWDDPPRDAAHLAGWLVTGVEAPLDERIISITLERPGKFRGSPTRQAVLDVSFIPSARGATLRAVGGNVLASVGARRRRASSPRPELAADEVARAVHERDVEALLRGRWMSGHLAAWLIAHPESAAERYGYVASRPEARPSRCDDRVVPLPLCDAPVAVDSLILERAAKAPAQHHAEQSSAARALARMRTELERSREAPQLREVADRLMVLGDTPAPAMISLGDGTTVPSDAKPNESAVHAAERMYKRVRSLERAAERLPARIAALENAPSAPGRAPATKAGPGRARIAGRSLPYRVYHSSGGIEILVGRGATSNDTLTFKVASPSDVWLHVRGASGAHVVLRWVKDETPPARDLEEAAILAAWHSKARGSAVVPVDWTRKKYVRRPRGGQPGVALVTQSATMMVRPDAAVERALRRVPNE